jgi:hypothetical protein
MVTFLYYLTAIRQSKHVARTIKPLNITRLSWLTVAFLAHVTLFGYLMTPYPRRSCGYPLQLWKGGVVAYFKVPPRPVSGGTHQTMETLGTAESNLKKKKGPRVPVGHEIQGGSNMTGTNCDLFTHKSSRSYLNHLVEVPPRSHPQHAKNLGSVPVTSKTLFTCAGTGHSSWHRYETNKWLCPSEQDSFKAYGWSQVTDPRSTNVDNSWR